MLDFQIPHFVLRSHTPDFWVCECERIMAVFIGLNLTGHCPDKREQLTGVDRVNPKNINSIFHLKDIYITNSKRKGP